MVDETEVTPSANRVSGMFGNLGLALGLIREVRKLSQKHVARSAGVGKSQLSKYESGKEFPKLDSLEKVLTALKVDYLPFFYTLALVDKGIPEILASDQGTLPPQVTSLSVFDPPTDEAFAQVFHDLLALQARIFALLLRKR